MPSQGDVANDAALEVDANSSAGSIIGSGAVTVAAGVTLSANNLIQDSLTMALGGTTPAANAKISTTFALSLAHLTVTLAGGFAPAAGNSFDLLDWGSIAAPFSSVSLPTLSGSLSWNTSLLYTTGVISVVGTSVPGDYGGDGIVDAADYTIWRDTLGSTVDLRANGDIAGASAGKIDQADYNFWKSHFGTHVGSGAGDPETVPEPASWLSMLIALCVGKILLSFSLKSSFRLAIVGNDDRPLV